MVRLGVVLNDQWNGLGRSRMAERSAQGERDAGGPIDPQRSDNGLRR